MYTNKDNHYIDWNNEYNKTHEEQFDFYKEYGMPIQESKLTKLIKEIVSFVQSLPAAAAYSIRR